MGLFMRGMMLLILDKASLTFSQEGVQELVDTYECLFEEQKNSIGMLRLLKDPTLPGCSTKGIYSSIYRCHSSSRFRSFTEGSSRRFSCTSFGT